MLRRPASLYFDWNWPCRPPEGTWPCPARAVLMGVGVGLGDFGCQKTYAFLARRHVKHPRRRQHHDRFLLPSSAPSSFGSDKTTTLTTHPGHGTICMRFHLHAVHVVCGRRGLYFSLYNPSRPNTPTEASQAKPWKNNGCLAFWSYSQKARALWIATPWVHDHDHHLYLIVVALSGAVPPEAVCLPGCGEQTRGRQGGEGGGRANSMPCACLWSRTCALCRGHTPVSCRC